MSSVTVRGLFVVLILTGFSVARAATPEEVDKAIKKGVEWFYSQQNANFNWETEQQQDKDWKKELSKTEGGQWGGLTAISLYAMLDAGESWRDPRIKNAIEWIYRAPITGTYAVALRAQVWTYLPQNQMVRNAAQRDCSMLLAGMKSKGDARGFWSYLVSDHASTRYDHSCSQIALLGIWACQQAGREVPLAFWREAENAWRGHQNDDGSWSYVFKGSGEHGQGKLSMTLAGAATLFITQDYVHAQDGLACKGNLWDDRLVKASRWIHDHFGEGGGGYVLYGFERVAVASGYKYFGEHDWYKVGAERVVRAQRADGSWGSIPETAFNLIFLSRGRQPVIVNKFEYALEGTPAKNYKLAPRTGPELLPEANNPEQPAVNPDQPAPEKPKTYIANWCQRPRDIAVFTKWMTSALERRLNWQIVSDTNTVDDYHDAPVLYIAGDQKLTFPKATIDKLRQYVEEGGLILGHADCNSKDFTESFKQLGATLFPRYEFRELPADHPIFTRQQYQRRNWKNPPSVQAMSNGIRELMVISPNNDLARWWQQNAYKNHEESFELLNSLILYNSDRNNFKYKGATHVVRANPVQDGTEPLRKLKIARFAWQGNWNPEPAGWRRLAAILHNQKLADLSVDSFPLGENKVNAEIHPIAHLTGTGGYTFTKEQLTELRKYIIKGGIIICDAAGGNTEFASTIEPQLDSLITGAKFEYVPPTDPILKEIANTKALTGPLLARIAVPTPASTQPTTAPTTLPATGLNPSPATAPATQTATTLPMPPVARPKPGLLGGDSAAPTTQESDPPTTAPSGRVVLAGNVPVEYRRFARTRMGETQNLRLKGMKFRGRWVVLFSAEDLSTGMVGQQVDGVAGYTPPCATELMRRLVMNLAPPPPAPKPDGQQ